MAMQGPGAGRHKRGVADTARRNPVPAFLAAIGLAWLALANRRTGGPTPAPQRQRPPHQPSGGTQAPGRTAELPTEIPPRGWWDVLMRVKDEIAKDNMSIIAAGCGFYALLALFPGISALVAIYGLVADPAQIEQQMASMQGVVPEQAFGIIRDQVHAVAAAGSTALGWGAALAIALALYSASAGVKSIFEALNIAYEEEESRNFLVYNLTALAFTLATIVALVVGLIVIVGVPIVLSYLPLGPLAEWGVRIVSWLILLALVAVGIGMLYRFGPSRAPATWKWVTPGSILATLLWVLASIAFSIYAAKFGSYNETYGALGGVIVLLMWLYLSAFSILIGAELNSELELQTERDTTTGPAVPRGQRSAYAADHVHDERAADPARA